MCNNFCSCIWFVFFPFTAIPCHDFQQAPIFSYFYIAEYSSTEKQVSLPFLQLCSGAVFWFSAWLFWKQTENVHAHTKKAFVANCSVHGLVTPCPRWMGSIQSRTNETWTRNYELQRVKSKNTWHNDAVVVYLESPTSKFCYCYKAVQDRDNWRLIGEAFALQRA